MNDADQRLKALEFAFSNKMQWETDEKVIARAMKYYDFMRGHVTPEADGEMIPKSEALSYIKDYVSDGEPKTENMKFTIHDAPPAIPMQDLGKADQSPGAYNHASDCAVNNEPALPAGPCDCGFKPYAYSDDDFENAKTRIVRPHMTETAS